MNFAILFPWRDSTYRVSYIQVYLSVLCSITELSAHLRALRNPDPVLGDFRTSVTNGVTP